MTAINGRAQGPDESRKSCFVVATSMPAAPSPDLLRARKARSRRTYDPLANASEESVTALGAGITGVAHTNAQCSETWMSGRWSARAAIRTASVEVGRL
jgi:hypothetical protein